ncbi:MAG TPA: hypothetical protein VFO34_11355 [Candidatus Acidoferrales bacterium]|nr:hypothetical protein [Candidatus Acidoferrales bacterium]
MIAAIILTLSCVTLAEFFVSYCRSQIMQSKLISLSQDTVELAAIANRSVAASQFERLIQLARMCPRFDKYRSTTAAIRVYYALLTAVGLVARRLAPGIVGYIERERSGCAYYAAAALERRIALSRELYTQQIASAGL